MTRPGGLVLDCFAGSGSTGIACVLEGFDFVGIEKEHEYVEIAKARIAHAETHPWDFDPDIPEPRKGDEPVPGQLGFEGLGEPQPKRLPNQRDGEASAERRYTDRGGSNFAMKPGRRR